MRIVEGPTGTGPATWPRGWRATWHRANGHMAVGIPLPTQTPAMGSEGELDSGQHQAGAGPARRERLPVAAATHGGDVGDASAAAHASVGQLAGPPGCRPGPLAGMQVRVLPGVQRGARRDQPMAGDGSRLGKRRAHTGVRVRSSLPPLMEGDAGVARRPVATRVVALAMRFDSSTFRQALSVQLEWTPACRAGDHGFESRTERALPWWLLAANPDFQSGPRGFDPRPRHTPRPPWSSGQGRPVLSREDAGSSPAGGTDALVAEPADAPPSSSGAPVACGFDSHREHERKHTHLPER